jgi:hypothetical protein
LGDAITCIVHKSEVVLGQCIPLYGCLGIPFKSFFIILRDAMPSFVRYPEIVLGNGLLVMTT